MLGTVTKKSHLHPASDKAAGFRWLLQSLDGGVWPLRFLARRIRLGSAGLAVLLVLRRYKPDRPFGRIRRHLSTVGLTVKSRTSQLAVIENS